MTEPVNPIPAGQPDPDPVVPPPTRGPQGAGMPAPGAANGAGPGQAPPEPVEVGWGPQEPASMDEAVHARGVLGNVDRQLLAIDRRTEQIVSEQHTQAAQLIGVTVAVLLVGVMVVMLARKIAQQPGFDLDLGAAGD